MQWLVGVQNPRYFMYIFQVKQGINEEEGVLSTGDWRVQIWRTFFLFYTINVCFFILYLLSISLRNALGGSVGWERGWQVLGPGFDSQVPHIFFIFFLMLSGTSLLKRSTIRTQV